MNEALAEELCTIPFLVSSPAYSNPVQDETGIINTRYIRYERLL
jgi:hypothetical protein